MGMIKDPTSWRVGFELGLAGFSFPYSKPRKPTAYLYNGVRLPALPEWDREMYPYLLMVHYFSTEFLYALQDIPVFLSETSVKTQITGPTIHVATLVDSAWKTFQKEQSNSLLGTPTWANFDLPKEDGTVYLAASEPVPVYE